MRFKVVPPDFLQPELLPCAHLTGPDRYLWKSRIEWDGQFLVAQRVPAESGFFHLLADVPGWGRTLLSTAWLMEREKPYHLQVELARGHLHQLRTQYREWTALGLRPCDEAGEYQKRAFTALRRAIASAGDDETAGRLALESVAASLHAGIHLVQSYVRQGLPVRLRQQDTAPPWLAMALGRTVPEGKFAESLKDVFHAVQAALCWRDVQPAEDQYQWQCADAQLRWARVQGVKTLGGPLIAFHDLAVPDWLSLYHGDLNNLRQLLGEFVTQAVSRYRGQVDLWHCAAGINGNTHMDLSEEEHLVLAARAVELAHRLDPETPAIVSFDQPWGEYMAQQEVEPPLYLADMMVRAGVPLSGVGLELNWGFHPGGTLPRDLLALNQLIDRWSLLGLPLYVFLTLPSSTSKDSLATENTKVMLRNAQGTWDEEDQAGLLRQILGLLLTKPVVHGVCWNQLQDNQPHRFPFGGLVDCQGHPKPAWLRFKQLRRKMQKSL